MKYTLFMGFLVLAAGVAGCAQGPQAPAASVGAPATVAEPPADYATQLAEWVEAHQSDKEARNRWQEFFEVSAAVCAAWEYFTLSNERIVAEVAKDPGKNYGATEPGLIDAPEYAGLVPELRKFFATLDKTKLMDRMDELAGPSRFVALRAVDPLVTTSMPELGRARLCVRICIARMRLAAMDGKTDEVVRSLRHALAMARGAQGRGLPISVLVGNAAWWGLDREVQVEILDGRLDAETCATMLRVLTETPRLDARTGLGGDRFLALETIELFFEQVKKEAAQNQAQAAVVDRGVGGAVASRDEQIAEANRLHRAIDETFSEDRSTRVRASEEIAAMESRWNDGTKAPRYQPLNTLMPAIGSIKASDQKQRLQRDGTRIMLALEVFRGREGRYPARLEELTPGVMESLPPDPFAREGTFGYRRLDANGGDAAKSYVLYSVGFDGEDNGAKVLESRRINAIGPGLSGGGYDYIINSREP